MNFLKKTTLIAFSALTVFSFSSCSDDEGDSPAQSPAASSNISSSSLVGDWVMSSLNYTGRSTTTVGGVSFTSEFSGVGKDFTYAIEFKDNPKTYTTSGGYVVELTTTSNGTSFTQDAPISDVVSSGTWSFSNNMLSITDDATNETSTTEILSAGANDFAMDFAGFFGKSVGGADVVITSGEVSYKRR